MTRCSLPTVLLLLLTLSQALSAATTYHVALGGDDGDPGTAAEPWATLQHAADTVGAGDTVLIAPGTYTQSVHITSVGASGAPITFRAESSGVILDASSFPNTHPQRDVIFIDLYGEASDQAWVTVEGITVLNAPRSGLRASWADHVTVRDCLFADGGTWGIFTDFTDDLLLENNECRGSVGEHGIYVSNSSDRVTIRGNHCHDNARSGIQINADPAYLDPGDGISSECLVENNICHDNGAGGASGINLASVRNSVIRNNLIWGNQAGGIAGWGDGNGPAWGTMDNEFYHNTVWFRSGEGRWALSLKEGSVRNTIRNNIFVGGRRGAIEMDSTSLVNWVCDHNLLRSLDWPYVVTNETTDASYDLAGWQGLGYGQGSLDVDPQFLSTSTGDFHLDENSLARDAGTTISGILTDLEGGSRVQGAGPDFGCYEYASPSTDPSALVFR